ncbi:hypothetical protein [Allosphingosinicella vermicomposti]|uniref:hypothetical protein n=1 Tax=Allosphingosinicella vermicomposti TaxID=614671 RepID=UPI000D111B52|nr:hypothetical protein [Allosphingosinicella vermicomposti]
MNSLVVHRLPASREELKTLIEAALTISDNLGTSVVGCYLQMAFDQFQAEGTKPELYELGMPHRTD